MEELRGHEQRTHHDLARAAISRVRRSAWPGPDSKYILEINLAYRAGYFHDATLAVLVEDHWRDVAAPPAVVTHLDGLLVLWGRWDRLPFGGAEQQARASGSSDG